MRSFEGARAPAHMTGAERTKLVVLALGAVVILAAIVVSQWRASGQDTSDLAHMPAEPVLELPELPADEVAGLVADGTPEARIRLERPAVDLLMESARRLTPRHYEAFDTPLATAEQLAAINADPAAWRAKPLSIRGEVLHARIRRPAPDRDDEYRLLIATEDGGRVHGLAARLPGMVQAGDWLRLDGLVLKRFSDELPVGPGGVPEWVDAPLVVGWLATPSSPPLGPMPALAPGSLAGVRDDTLDAPGDLSLPERHVLLAHARDLPAGGIDWSSAPELDAALLAEILEAPEAHRGMPFRLPVSQLQALRRAVPGENPARIERISELWIGNANWDQRVRLIHAHAPYGLEDLARGDLVTARLLFLKNYAYESVQGARHVAPFFAVVEAERFVAPEPFGMRLLLWGVAVTTLVMVAILAFLVRRDRRRSEEFVRRRLEQRRRRAPGAPSGS
jgi:hypothetical protein